MAENTKHVLRQTSSSIHMIFSDIHDIFISDCTMTYAGFLDWVKKFICGVLVFANPSHVESTDVKGGLNNEIFVSWIKHIWLQLLCVWSIQISLSHLKMCQYLGSVWLLFFFWNTLILLFSKDAFNWIKVTVKTFTMLQNMSISNQCCSC